MKYRGREICLCIFLCVQHFSISTIEYVIFLTHHLTELLEILPGIMDIKLIAVPPDVKKFWGICFKFDKILSQLEQMIHLHNMINRRLKLIEICLWFKIIG